MFLIVCHSVLSIVIILLGVSGMKMISLNNGMDSREFGGILALMCKSVRWNIYIFEALLHTITLFHIPPYMKTCLLIFVLFLTVFTTNSIMFDQNTGNMSDTQLRKSVYRCRDTHSLWTWVIYITSLLVIDCWSSIALIVIIFRASSEFLLCILKHRVHPDSGWGQLKSVLIQKGVHKSKRHCH